MTRCRVAVFLVAVLFCSCGRKPATHPATQTSSSPSPFVTASPLSSPAQAAISFAELAQHVRQAVVIVSVFDDTGHLIANGHGFFVSDDGKLVADRSIMAGGVNGVAKTANGAIYNISGALAYGVRGNSVLLKADVRRVPFVRASANAVLETADRVAVVLSPIERSPTLLVEAKLTRRSDDQIGEWFEVVPPLPGMSIGAPVINVRGEVVGIVSYRAENNSCVIRPAIGSQSLLSQITPNLTGSWHTPVTPNNAPPLLPSPIQARSPPKIPARGSKLIYSPAPRYPTELKSSHSSVRGSGSYRISFDAGGRAINVQVVRSAGNGLLDGAALSGLRQWRSEGGQDWTLIVPITFEP